MRASLHGHQGVWPHDICSPRSLSLLDLFSLSLCQIALSLWPRYAFRPMPGGTTEYGPGPAAGTTVRVTLGKLVQQVCTDIDLAAGVSACVRVVAGEPAVRLIGSMGPLDVSNHHGQEAIVRVDSTVRSDGRWLTDANGQRMMVRQRRSTTPTYVRFFQGFMFYSLFFLLFVALLYCFFQC
jgi:hypothetical protein